MNIQNENIVNQNDDDKKSMSYYKNLHKNEDIYVIASGKSLDFIDPSFFEGKITIGINQVFKRIKCKYLVRKEVALLTNIVENNKDSVFFISRGDCGGSNNKNEMIVKKNNYKNVVIFPHKRNMSHLRVNQVFNNINLDANELLVSYSTITTGIHLAAFMGAKNIILVGHDCGKINGELNFTGYHTDATYRIAWRDGAKGYERWITSGAIEQDTIQLKQILKRIYGCNVLSLNPFINFGLEGNNYVR
jgi:hypothetical protein